MCRVRTASGALRGGIPHPSVGGPKPKPPAHLSAGMTLPRVFSEFRRVPHGRGGSDPPAHPRGVRFKALPPQQAAPPLCPCLYKRDPFPQFPTPWGQEGSPSVDLRDRNRTERQWTEMEYVFLSKQVLLFKHFTYKCNT